MKIYKRGLFIQIFCFILLWILPYFIKKAGGTSITVYIINIIIGITMVINCFRHDFYYKNEFISINSFKVYTYKNCDAYVYRDNVWLISKSDSKKVDQKKTIKITQFYNMKSEKTFKICSLPSLNTVCFD